MSLRLYNSLTRTKESFKPFLQKEVLMYVCGITPNNATHVGHAFTYVSFDVIKRYLEFSGFTVNYLQNATDINDSDDVIKQAKDMGKTWDELASYWIAQYKKNMMLLNVLEPTEYVKATSAIEKIIEISKMLIQKGFAYEVQGNVYFNVKKFPQYGELSRFNEEQMLMISRERGNNPDDPFKKNPLDFILWFASDEKPSWESPWRSGRPGWHIECSAMIHDYLGPQIDIHGGGRDLVFPHHESEIAQSQNFTGKSPYVKYWMHTGMVLYEGEKMSKSLGNLVNVSDVLEKYNPNAIRFLILSHHYRKPWEYLESELQEAEEKWKKIVKSLKGIASEQVSEKDLEEFSALMDDDFNIPEVLRCILVSLKSANMDEKKKSRKILEVLGFSF
jgi:cysteinyl-tRNA synthetase